MATPAEAGALGAGRAAVWVAKSLARFLPRGGALGFAGEEAAVPAFQECVKKKESGQREQDQAHEQAVDRGDRTVENCPDDSEQREDAEHNGNQEHHGPHATSFWVEHSETACGVEPRFLASLGITNFIAYALVLAILHYGFGSSPVSVQKRCPVRWMKTSSSVGLLTVTARISPGNASTTPAMNRCPFSNSIRTWLDRTVASTLKRALRRPARDPASPETSSRMTSPPISCLSSVGVPIATNFPSLRIARRSQRSASS